MPSKLNIRLGHCARASLASVILCLGISMGQKALGDDRVCVQVRPGCFSCSYNTPTGTRNEQSSEGCGSTEREIAPGTFMEPNATPTSTYKFRDYQPLGLGLGVITEVMRQAMNGSPYAETSDEISKHLTEVKTRTEGRISNLNGDTQSETTLRAPRIAEMRKSIGAAQEQLGKLQSIPMPSAPPPPTLPSSTDYLADLRRSEAYQRANRDPRLKGRLLPDGPELLDLLKQNRAMQYPGIASMAERAVEAERNYATASPGFRNSDQSRQAEKALAYADAAGRLGASKLSDALLLEAKAARYRFEGAALPKQRAYIDLKTQQITWADASPGAQAVPLLETLSGAQDTIDTIRQSVAVTDAVAAGSGGKVDGRLLSYAVRNYTDIAARSVFATPTASGLNTLRASGEAAKAYLQYANVLAQDGLASMTEDQRKGLVAGATFCSYSSVQVVDAALTGACNDAVAKFNVYFTADRGSIEETDLRRIEAQNAIVRMKDETLSVIDLQTSLPDTMERREARKNAVEQLKMDKQKEKAYFEYIKARGKVQRLEFRVERNFQEYEPPEDPLASFVANFTLSQVMDHLIKEGDATPLGWKIWEGFERISEIKDLIEAFFSLDAGDPVFDDDMPALGFAREDLAKTEKRLRDLLGKDQAEALMDFLRSPRSTVPVLEEPQKGPTLRMPLP